MKRKSDTDWIQSAPRWIVMSAGTGLIGGAFTICLWNAARGVFSNGTLGNAPVPAATVLAALDFGLCAMVWRAFPAGAPLRGAWFLFAVAAALRTVSELMGGNAGLIAGGPAQLAALATGMLVVLRVLRRFGFWRRLGASDWAVCGLGVLFMACRVAETAAKAGGTANWISLAGLPVLCVLLLEAMTLRRAVVRMGNGLIAKCWAALVAAVLLRGVAEVMLWAIPHYSQTLPLLLCRELIRVPMAAAFALVPAYQAAARRRALKPPTAPAEELATTVPALAE